MGKINEMLKGVKVADFSAFASGPSCTKLLAEYGADNILVESLNGIGGSRGLHYNDFFNGNKRSVAVDLKTPEGQEIARKIIEQADVFVTNYRQKALDSLHLDYESVKKINPKIIYGAIYGWGPKGPRANEPAFDTTAFWSASGLWRDCLDKDAPVTVPPPSVGDSALGMALALGIVTGLYHREVTGEAVNVSSSLFALGIYLNVDIIAETQYGTVYPGSRKAPVRSLLNIYKCKDGWVSVVSMVFDKEWKRILKAIGREDLIGDPRWTCYDDTMNDKSSAVVEILDAYFATVTCDEAIASFQSVDMALERLGSTEDLLHDPQALENGYLFPFHDCLGNDVLMPASPISFGDGERGEYKQIPRIGEHTEEVLHELGYTDEQIRDMDSRKVIFAELDGKRAATIPITWKKTPDHVKRMMEEKRAAEKQRDV